MNKIEGTSILNQMKVILLQHAISLSSVDLDAGINTMMQFVEGQALSDKSFLWLCDGHESWILPEKNLFIDGTSEYNQLLLFGMSKHVCVVSFCIEVSGVEDGQLIGLMFPVDLRGYWMRVIENAVKPDATVLVYEQGIMTRVIDKQDEDLSLGRFLRFDEQAAFPTALRRLINDERRRRVEDLEISNKEKKDAV